MKRYILLFIATIFIFSSCSIFLEDRSGFGYGYPSEGVYYPENRYPEQSPEYTPNKHRRNSQPAFNQLLKDLRRASFDDNRLDILSSVNIELSSKNVARLLSEFSFDKNKLTALSILLPNVIDLHNFRIIVNSFSTIRYREEAQLIIYNYLNSDKNRRYDRRYDGYGYSRAMTEREFNDFMREFDRQSFDSEKLTLLRAASNGYFRAYQVAHIMNKFTFDSEKLKVLRILAESIEDRQSAYRIIATLDFDSSKREAESILGIRR